MEASECPECKQRVGGVDHIVAPGNQKIDDNPVTKVNALSHPGISNEPPASLEDYYTVRYESLYFTLNTTNFYAET